MTILWLRLLAPNNPNITRKLQRNKNTHTCPPTIHHTKWAKITGLISQTLMLVHSYIPPSRIYKSNNLLFSAHREQKVQESSPAVAGEQRANEGNQERGCRAKKN